MNSRKITPSEARLLTPSMSSMPSASLPRPSRSQPLVAVGLHVDIESYGWTTALARVNRGLEGQAAMAEPQVPKCSAAHSPKGTPQPGILPPLLKNMSR
jgi:hypothetical protein